MGDEQQLQAGEPPLHTPQQHPIPVVRILRSEQQQQQDTDNKIAHVPTLSASRHAHAASSSRFGR